MQFYNTYPIVEAQVVLGAQVIAEVQGEELRDLAGVHFSVPRVPGNYDINVTAKDINGCSATTSGVHLMTVF